MNVEKYKHSLHLQNCVYKHRGDVLAVSKELNLPIPYVKKAVSKMKRQMRHDVGMFAAHSIMEHLLSGYEQRNVYLRKCLDVLDGTESVSVSDCCGVPCNPPKGKKETVCKACNKQCEIVLIPRKDTVSMTLQTIDQLRKEDETLVSFAEKMGFTDAAPRQNVRQNIVMINTGGDSSHHSGRKVIDCDTEVHESAETMTPQEREQARKKVEQYLLGLSEDLDKIPEEKT